VAQHVWKQYVHNTPSRTLMLDVFMAFLVLVGGIQFLYAIVGGNYVRVFFFKLPPSPNPPKKNRN
jgi:hypothetical protein